MTTPTDDRPIGMFDSGFGGLTVARALIDLLPHEHLVYLGDTGRYPYGPRALAEVAADAKLIAQYRVYPLGKRGGRLFIACADPTDQEAVERIKFATQLAPEWVIVEHDKLAKLLEGSAATASAT